MFGWIPRARSRLEIPHRRFLGPHYEDVFRFQRLPRATNALLERFSSSILRESTPSCRQLLFNCADQASKCRPPATFQLSQVRALWHPFTCATRTERCRLNAFAKISQRSSAASMERKSPFSGPEPWQRSLNLELNGESTAKNDRAVKEIMLVLQHSEDLEIVRLAEHCSVSLLVRHSESKLWLGVSVRATQTNGRNRLRFTDCHKSPSILNICTALPSAVREPFRWWVVPGEQLRHSKSGVLTITLSSPIAKWRRFEVLREKLASVISQELLPRVKYQLELSEWSIPKSPQHQREREFFLRLKEKVFVPLGCKIKEPEMPRTPIDMIIDDIYVQNKTAYVSKGMLGLRININKHGGHKENGKPSVQPYSVHDGIHAIFVNVPQGANLVGLFIFPSEEITKHGWFQGNGHIGKIFVDIYPPYLSPKKNREWLQEWQLEYYIDLSNEVDLDRTRMLLERCKRKSGHCPNGNKRPQSSSAKTES